MELELPTFDLDIGGGVDIGGDLGLDVSTIDFACDLPSMEAGPGPGLDFTPGLAVMDSVIDTPLGVSYDVTGELDSGLVATINQIGAMVLAETATAPSLINMGEAPVPEAVPELPSTAPLAPTLFSGAKSPLTPPSLLGMRASEPALSGIHAEAIDFISTLDPDVMAALESPTSSYTIGEPTLLYVEPNLVDNNQPIAKSQLIFSDLLTKGGMSLENTSLITSHGQQNGQTFTDNTRFATTASGLLLIHNERVFPQTGTTTSEIIVSHDSVASYLQSLKEVPPQRPVLNIGWSKENRNYALTWREGKTSHAFPQDVEMKLRQGFPGPVWEALPRPDNPIVLVNKFVPTTKNTQPENHRVVQGVNDALNGLQPYVTRPHLTLIPE